MKIISMFEDEDLVGQLALGLRIRIETAPIALKGNDGKTLRKKITEQSKSDHDRARCGS